MAVLGAISIDNACIKGVAGQIDALDFYHEGHREIFKSMLQLNLQRKPIDFITLNQILKDTGKLEAVGGGSYLAELLDATPTSANVAYYTKIVKEKSTGRQLVDFARSIAVAVSEGRKPEDVISDAKSGLSEIAGSLDGMNGVSVADLLTFEMRQERYQEYIRQISTRRFRTGFACIDREIRGVAPGEVMTIIAYSGTFKSAFLQNLLLRGCESTKMFSLLLSLEMPSDKCFERECQIQGGASGWDVENHFRGKRESASVVAGLQRLGSHGLLVCDRPRLTLEKVSRYIELARQKYGELCAVGIDYAGLLHAPGKSLFEKTAFISIEIKNLAKELNVPIISLCQINRAAAVQGGDIEMSAAKGGGDVEAAADFMLGLQDEKGTLVCKILKNRNGKAGEKFVVDIDRTALQFREMTEYSSASVSGGKNIPF
jgi:replicative DNA helicase